MKHLQANNYIIILTILTLASNFKQSSSLYSASHTNQQLSDNFNNHRHIHNLQDSHHHQQQQQLQQQQQQPHHVNECSRKPNICQNGATCVSKPGGGYTCICVNGWAGQNCTENVNDCSSAACENGATCHDRVGHFYCECTPDKTGLLCQLDNGCYNNPCHPNATCDPSPVDGRPVCTCPPGFSGADCSIDNDECAAGSPCEHGGSCVNMPGSFRCECPRGFTGTRCEININECEINPCMNEGTCLDEKGGYKCICMPGYTGTKCETNIDECAQNPCQNGATCKDEINSFRCLCPAGYWGERCEFNQSSPRLAFPELSPENPWSRCYDSLNCWTKFKNNVCDQECNHAECLYDGNDCITVKQFNPTTTSSTCNEKSDNYCLKNYANGVCDQECNSQECSWDGLDCDNIGDENDIINPINTRAQGLLVMRVEPAIEFGSESDSRIELARLLRKVSVTTGTVLKIQSYRSVEQGRGTEIELIADNRKCLTSCYNNTDLIAKFLGALRNTTKDFDKQFSPHITMTEVGSRVQPVDQTKGQSTASTWMVIVCSSFGLICAIFMVVSIGKKQKVKEKAITWFPEGFKPVLSSRNRDPTDRKPPNGRGVSTLQALGGNFFRGIKRNERSISTNPNGFHSTDVDRCTATPNGGAIYHEPYEQYDQYGSTYNPTDAGSICQNIEEPMTPASMVINPINMEGPHGLTPLMVASMGQPFSREPLGLVAYGTTGEMNGPSDNNVTDLLQRGAQLNLANKATGETALHLAARHGRVDAARSLLERCNSQDVNAQDDKGRTPLHTAVGANSEGVFELLIRHRGVDLNAQMYDGTTPLILAARIGIYSMLEELIQNECDVTKSDANGKTALHWAAATNNVDAIRRLLEVKETNKDAQDLAEETPLFLACKEGAKGAVEMLLSHYANKDISDQMDRDPIEIARSRQHFDIVRLLENHEPRSPPTPRSIASIHHSGSRQISPFSPNADSNSNSNSSSIPPPPPPTYHTHSQSGRQGGRQAQKAALARSNSTKPLIAEANIIRNSLQSHCRSVMVIKTDLNSPTKPNAPISLNQIHRSHQSLGNNNNNNNHSHNNMNHSTTHVPPPAYDDCQTFWSNNNNNGPNAVNINNNNNNIMDKTTHGISEVYNVPCLKNYLTPSPDSPFSLESMASPPGAYNDQQYQNLNHPNMTSQKQAGVFI